MSSPEQSLSISSDGEANGEKQPDNKVYPCVYFIYSQGLVKIGRTINLPKRLSSLQRDGFPHGTEGFGPIEKTLVIRTNKPVDLEGQIHLLMQPEHITHEWFHIKESDMDTLKSLFGDSMGNFEKFIDGEYLVEDVEDYEWPITVSGPPGPDNYGR